MGWWPGVRRSGCWLSWHHDQGCCFGRAMVVVAFGCVQNHVAQRRGLVLWLRGIDRFAHGWWMIVIRRCCGGRRGWSQRCLVGRFEVV